MTTEKTRAVDNLILRLRGARQDPALVAAIDALEQTSRALHFLHAWATHDVLEPKDVKRLCERALDLKA